MAISVRQISEKCLRPRGPFSIVRNILGYNGPGVPQATSLINELRRFRDLEHVVLHIKIVSTAAWAFGGTNPIDQMIFSMKMVFGNANIAVIIRSTENLMLTDTDIDVGGCSEGTSADLDVLFTNRNFVGPFEIVVYFVRTVLKAGTKILNGCATSTHERPGATVARDADSMWTLAHEVGHVIGLRHVEGVPPCPMDMDPPDPSRCILTNVMTCCGTGSIPAGTTPTFDAFQKEVINLSPLTQRCPA